MSTKFQSKRLPVLLLLLALAGCVDVDAAEENEEHPSHAVLFPAFTVTIGVVVFLLLTRFVKVLPYTAVLFLIGTMMGIGASLLDVTDQLTESIRIWSSIDSEVLLLTFLPGIIFRDAMNQSVHLFRMALPQLLLFAFPMVLAGTVLTALIAYYIFPYGWSFNLAMTFGSILSATDPVAVAALLNQVGAPPRLKVHVAGESLLNDGSAIVFFTIFLERYLSELGIEGLGEDVDLPKGIIMFVQKALGGAAIGACFGLGLVGILHFMDRKSSREENVMEVSATIAVAYVGYYVAEPVFHTSGVISTVVTGLIVKFLGSGMINNQALFEDFWEIVENLLNTILFTLGGAVWGSAIARGEREGSFDGQDWGFLILLYVLLFVIRAFLYGAAYPITSRIGLKTCWQETVFHVYGGLRGAVGIALAISLDNEVVSNTTEEESGRFQEQTNKAFGFVGGIAFMTLVFNGTTAGPFLKMLGLADSSKTRKKIIEAYKKQYRIESIRHFVRLTTRPRFRHVNFALVKKHVPHLADMTKLELFDAATRYRDTTPKDDYEVPNFDKILPHLDDCDCGVDESLFSDAFEKKNGKNDVTAMAHARKIAKGIAKINRKKKKEDGNKRQDNEPQSTEELRTLFISILKTAYARQVTEGELEDQKFIQIALSSSLAFADDVVARGEPLQDWVFAKMIDRPIANIASCFRQHGTIATKAFRSRTANRLNNTANRIKMERAVAFMAAHRWAEKYFYEEFHDGELSDGGELVMQESRKEYEKAEAELKQFEKGVVERTVSHKFCAILLNSGVQHVQKLVQVGLLKSSEAEEWIDEIVESLDEVLACDSGHKPGDRCCDGCSDELEEEEEDSRSASSDGSNDIESAEPSSANEESGETWGCALQ